MDYIGFITFFIWMIILIALSFFVDYLLARIFSKGGHRFFVFLGVIIHEYSHAFGCLITGTKIKEIKLFEESGGHVTHQKRNAFITAIIAMMPLFGCSFFLIILAYLFSHIGVVIYTPHLAVSNINFLTTFGQFIFFAGKTFYVNIAKFSVITVFFILFIYLVGSIAACIAPSGVDLKHAFVGMVIIALIGFATIFLQPLGYIPGVKTEFHTATPMLDFIVQNLASAIGIGILGVFLILLVLVPVAIIKKK